MILVTHTAVGCAVASLFPNHPEIGFVAAFGSHFALDAIPHWDYPLRASIIDEGNVMKNNIALDGRFAKDLINIGLDVLVGLIISIYILLFLGRFSWEILTVGVLGGIVPDALQLVYMKLKPKSLILLQRFHVWIQVNKRLKNKPFAGILLQIFITTIIVGIIFIAT